MNEVQPTWMAPLIQSDSRLAQGFNLSVSRSTQPGAEPFVYGNNGGLGVLIDRRFQLDIDPPSYFRNHCGTMRDGFGNAGVQIKGASRPVMRRMATSLSPRCFTTPSRRAWLRTRC